MTPDLQAAGATKLAEFQAKSAVNQSSGDRGAGHGRLPGPGRRWRPRA